MNDNRMSNPNMRIPCHMFVRAARKNDTHCSADDPMYYDLEFTARIHPSIDIDLYSVIDRWGPMDVVLEFGCRDAQIKNLEEDNQRLKGELRDLKARVRSAIQ